MKLGGWSIFHRKDITFGDLTAKQLIILEHKDFFGILFFYFKGKKQDRFHTHAFNAISIKLFGEYTEYLLDDEESGKFHLHKRDYIFRYFPRSTYHSINDSQGCLTLVIQGPWKGTWKELKDGVVTYYSPGRVVCSQKKVKSCTKL